MNRFSKKGVAPKVLCYCKLWESSQVLDIIPSCGLVSTCWMLFQVVGEFPRVRYCSKLFASSHLLNVIPSCGRVLTCCRADKFVFVFIMN